MTISTTEITTKPTTSIGSGPPPYTPQKTGYESWTDEDIIRALKAGPTGGKLSDLIREKIRRERMSEPFGGREDTGSQAVG